MKRSWNVITQKWTDMSELTKPEISKQLTNNFWESDSDLEEDANKIPNASSDKKVSLA